MHRMPAAAFACRARRLVPPSGPLGAPPPYIVKAPPSRPAPPRVEMAPVPPAPEHGAGDTYRRPDFPLPAPAAAPVNMRVIGALGPPPPYRPIVQGAPVFGRGPAPDLEPWRLAALARIPAERAPRPEPAREAVEAFEDEWSLPRETGQAAELGPASADETRVERPEEYGPRDVPMVWPAEAEAPRMNLEYPFPRIGAAAVVVARRRRELRLLLGIGATFAIAAVAGPLIGRQPLMSRFPATVPVYAALGLAGKPVPAGAPIRDQAVPPPVRACKPVQTEPGEMPVSPCVEKYPTRR